MSASQPLGTKSTSVHEQAIIVDGTCPNPYWSDALETWQKSETTCCVVTVAGNVDNCQQTIRSIAAMHRLIRDRATQIALATTVDQVLAAKDSGRLAVVMQLQGTAGLEYDLNLLEIYARAGVRLIQLTYNQRCPIGDGCEEPGNGGLTAFGQRAVKEMNRLGIVVDVSHTGERTSRDATEASDLPVVASHSNPHRLYPSTRNISDDLITAISHNGGLVGINGYSGFLGKESQASLDTFVDNICYVAEMGGIKHVGLGLDYNSRNPPKGQYEWYIEQGIWSPDTYPPPPVLFPTGIEDASGFPALTARMLERQFSESDVYAVLGGNWMRVFGHVWK